MKKKRKRSQQKKKRSQLWLVTLTAMDQYVTRPRSGVCYHRPVIVVSSPTESSRFERTSMLIRSLTPRAAARKYIRGNLTAMLYTLEDMWNQPSDLFVANEHNHGKPHLELKRAKQFAKRLGAPVILIQR